MSEWTYSGIPKIEAILTEHLGLPKNNTEAWRRKALAADILLKLKEHAAEAIRLGKPGWREWAEEGLRDRKP